MGSAPRVTTYLEITDRGELRPAAPPRLPARIESIEPDPKLNRRLYEEIGAPFQWTDRSSWGDQRWREWASEVETWVAEVDGEAAGFSELRPAPRGAPAREAGVLIAIFGIREPYRGKGLGGALLTRSIERGLELAERVWVETNSTDAPHALASYEARGMRRVASR